MSGIASPVYGSYNGSSGAKLPSTVAYFAGEVRNNPINWSNGGVLVVVLEMLSTGGALPVQASGGVWVSAGMISFLDDVGHMSHLPCDWDIGDKIAIKIEVGADGTMVIKRLDS